MNVNFPDDLHGNPDNCQLLIAITGDSQAILTSLKEIVQRYEQFKKPVQCNLSQYGCYTTVITPRWNKVDYK